MQHTKISSARPRQSAPVDERWVHLASLRTKYDAQAHRVEESLRKMFRAIAVSGTETAERQSFSRVDATIESALRTAVRALDVFDDEPPARRRRQRAATRERRHVARFWRRELMRLVELRTRVSWLALDLPGALPPTVDPSPLWFTSARPSVGVKRRRSHDRPE